MDDKYLHNNALKYKLNITIYKLIFHGKGFLLGG